MERPATVWLRGHILDEASRAGVGAARVELWAFIDHAPNFVATTVSDASGHFAFERPQQADASIAVHGHELRVVDARGFLLHSEHHILGEEPSGDAVQLRIPADPDVAPAEEFETTDELGHSLGAQLETVETYETAVDPEPATGEQLSPTYRALQRSGLPISPEELVDFSTAELRQALIDGMSAEPDVDLAPQLDDLVEALLRDVAERAIETRPVELSPSRGAVLACLDLPTEQLREVLASYQQRGFAHSGAEAQGEAQAGLDESVASDVEACLQLTEVVGNDARLIRRLHQQRRRGDWETLEDLTSLEFEDWCDLVEACYREDLEAEGEEFEADYRLHVEARANAILNDFEAAYPSPYIHRRLASQPGLSQATRELLARSPGHDFLGDSIRARVAEEPPLLEGLAAEEAEQALDQLESVERISRITHRADEVSSLLAAGLDSAHGIAAVGRRAFVEAYAEELGGRAQAARVHASALQAASANQVAAIGLAQARQPAPFVLGAVPDTLNGVPHFRQLFGADALCDCVHCGSVYSPAAYLVDLLRYLGDAERLTLAAESIDAKRRGKASKRLQYKPLDLLLARRPDLADIPLTCENTLTPLPYIDLVNEILEARVTGQPWNPDTGKVPADVLKAIPQHTNRSAYDVLRTAVFPAAMPFHEPLEVFRAYVAQLGVSRLSLLQTFARGRARAEDTVAESLGMSREELALIVEPAQEPWRHWGFTAPTNEAAMTTELTPAPAFMKASGLSFAELVEVATLRFLSREGRLALVTPAVDCDPAQVRMEGLTPAGFEQVAKLIRLRRRVGWSFTELDRVLTALGAKSLDVATLQKLVEVRDLAKELHLPPSELLVLWAPLDTYGSSNAFSRLLHTRAVAWQLGDEPFRLRPDGLELQLTHDDITRVAPALMAAFRITHEELSAAIRLNMRRGQMPRLDLAGISAIYRVVLLARATNLAVRQLDGLLRLAPADADPFQPATPAGAVRFVHLVKEVQDSQFSPEQLMYLFLHEAEPRFDPTPRPAQIEAVLSSVRRGLVDAFVETTHPSEIAADTLRQKLALLLDASLLDAAVEALDPRTRLPEARRRDFFNRHLARIFAVPAAAADRLFASPGPAPNRPVEGEAEAEVEAEADAAAAEPARAGEQRARANAAFLLEHLLPLLRARQLRGAIVQVVSDSVGLSSASTGRLLEQILRSRRQDAQHLIVDFAALLGTGLTGAYYDNAELQGTPKLTRLEPELSFSWAGVAPAEGIPAVGFGARFSGRIHPKSKGEHTFYVSSDGAVRLTLVVDTEEKVLLQATGSRSGAVETSSEPIRLDAGKLYELRLEYRNQGGPASLALHFGTNPASKQAVPTTHLYPSDGLSSFAPVEESFRRVHKVALLLSTFGATDAHLEWLSGDTRPLDLDALPMQPGDEALAKRLFARWRQLAALYAFRKGLAPAQTDVFDVFRVKDAPEAMKRLLQATGWDASLVGEILGPVGLALGTEASAEPSEQPLLLRLSRAIEVQRRIGVSATTLFAWASAQPDVQMAAEAMQAVKARYDERRWLEVARGLNDPLRLARRDALVSYLLPRLENKGVLNRNQLFEYFLIDVDMNPCMLTSRIRQAIGSVQTYYQRCLMSLELTHPRLIDEGAWRWMKNYRVWEANRKVFLYPENWLEPELRDDKSPLFTAFERAILQDEIKKENVESAFIDYLQGLDEIARLDVRATCFEPDVARRSGPRRANAGSDWASGIQHVFGRTFGAPQAWYHRKLDAGLWSSWEKIEADIEGEHLLPVLFHGRMHLVWAIFREVSKKPPRQKRDSKGPMLELGKDWEIQLAYSVYDRGRWSRKRASSAGILDRMEMTRVERIDGHLHVVALPGSTVYAQTSYRLTTRTVSGSELRVQVWRRKLHRAEAPLDPLTIELVGEFILDGCNGELRRSHAEQLSIAHAPLLNTALRQPVFSRAPALRLQAPGGCEVDGQGFALSNARSPALTLAGGGAAPPAALLGRVESTESRVVLAGSPTAAAQGAPFFFQTAQHCFFAHPTGERRTRQSVTFGNFLHFGRVRPTAKSKGQRGRRGREGDETHEFDDDAAFGADPDSVEAWLQTSEAAESDAEARTLTEQDNWEDDEDEAWHPEDAEVRLPWRKRKQRTAAAPPAAARRGRPTPQRRPAAPTRRSISTTVVEQKMRFAAFQHAKSCDLLIALKSGGLEAMFELGARVVRDASSSFRRNAPTALVDAVYPRSDLDFDLASAYGAYNWELFFHAPLLVALRLAKEGRHEEAQRWFHFIFDPTVDDSDPSAKRFWRFLPLKLERHEGAQQVVAALSGAAPKNSPQAQNTEAQLIAWTARPFSPHVIAQLRFAAYQKTVVMKYIDNLLEWGDRLFRQDTMESIQEATQLYVLASNIMGPRPERIARIVDPPATTFRAIRGEKNIFANWMVRFETQQVRRPFRVVARPEHHGVTQALRMETEYFCVPHNPQLEKYWDTVQDRLHKIRNCMNIQGVVRQLPLFEPPIDPGMLVRAAAAGADLGSVVSGLNAPPPHHRFSFLMARALKLAEELRSFGQMTLQALERKDAEALVTLRANNESLLQRAIRDVRKVYVKQVEEELAELALQREELELKLQYLTAQTQELMNPQERASQAAMTLSKVYTIVTEGIELASKIAYAIPEIQSGGAGISSPFVTLQLGGQMFGSISSAVASTVQKLADRSGVEAELAEAQAEFQRRRAEWQQQIEVLNKEKAQLEKQIATANLKLDIATKELRCHDLEVENAGKVLEFLRSKFTNDQLYGWMLGQLAAVHFQVYKFAFDAAQQAQRAFQFERADASAAFIEFAYWDSLKRGLFAGERLLVDLRRLESAYLEGDRRALELTRHLSLRDDFPLALEELIGTGRCEFEVSEPLLDGDFPGHYLRRVKSVSLSAQLQTQRPTNLNCTLTLLSNRLRTDAGASGSYGPAQDGEDARFLNNPVPVQTIATSRASGDAGLFELKFDDVRYLPFEGAGAISKWRLVMQQSDNALHVARFDDVVVSLSYTARDGGAALEAAARSHRVRSLAQGTLSPSPHYRVSLRRDLPELFRQLTEQKAGPDAKDVEGKLALTVDQLPGRFRPFDVRIERVAAFVHPRGRALLAPDGIRLRLDPPRGPSVTVGGFHQPWPNSKSLRGVAESGGSLGEWKLAAALIKEEVREQLADLVLCFELRVRS